MRLPLFGELGCSKSLDCQSGAMVPVVEHVGSYFEYCLLVGSKYAKKLIFLNMRIAAKKPERFGRDLADCYGTGTTAHWKTRKSNCPTCRVCNRNPTNLERHSVSPVS
ncbi:MAG TPA: hypothetical protein VGM26_06315 [Rhizomicrobium sp.]